MKAVWSLTSSIGLRPVSWLGSFYGDTVCSFSEDRHPSVKGRVALTIDDGLCRSGRERSLIQEVRELLKAHGATATFFICSDYTQGFEEEARQLLEDGHEFGNHCPKDREYASLPAGEFEREFLDSNAVIERLGGQAVWFRAPQGRYSSAMRAATEKHGLRHALGDCYCDDWAIKDPVWIAETLSKLARSGSIIILHMPERGFREHTLEALRQLLETLTARGLSAVTLSTLAELAEGNTRAAPPSPTGAFPALPGVEPGDLHVTPYRGFPSAGFCEERSIVQRCSEEKARTAAAEAVAADPENCVAEVVSRGAWWSAKAYTAAPDTEMAFKKGPGYGYLVYHERTRCKPPPR